MRSKKTKESETPNFWRAWRWTEEEKGEEKDPEEEEDEGEEDLLPASFGKYPAHPKKGRAAPLSALGGPETIFLGTGCAEPSKYRAASAILLRDEEEGGASKSSILLDCGEGCLGAMRRYLGREECLNALKTLKMIWISHHHPDHCLGILAILDLDTRLCDNRHRRRRRLLLSLRHHLLYLSSALRQFKSGSKPSRFRVSNTRL